MAHNGNSGSVFLAFLIGAAAGAAVALLYAPATGEEMRRKLAEKAREGRERADELAREGRDFVSRNRDNIISAVERGREAFDEARKETL